MVFLFYLAFVVAPLAAGVLLIVQVRKHRRLFALPVWGAIFGVVLATLVNPLTQVLILEDLDTSRGSDLARQAREAGLVGMNMNQVSRLFGTPEGVLDNAVDSTWEYKQLPGYWFGSHFQVFFESGQVVGFEPNDD
jgi:hypothetical protein